MDYPSDPLHGPAPLTRGAKNIINEPLMQDTSEGALLSYSCERN